MKKFTFIAIAALAIFCSSSCQKELVLSGDNVKMKEVSLNLGFDTKTYLKNGKVVWGSNEHVQVFTDKNLAYDFVSTSKSGDEKATFTGNIPEGDKIKYILYSGKTTAASMEIDENGRIVGTDIALTTKQDPSVSHSFKNNYAYAIMKDGDTALKNVFGLVKMNFPAYDSGQSRIHRVVISADQYISGRFALNYTGEDPVVDTIFANSVAKKVITVTTRFTNNQYESGEIYGLMAPGTYSGFKMTVYPFDHEPTSKADTVIATPFVIEALNAVTVTRSNWINAGTLPYEKPASKTKCSTPSGLSANIDGTTVSLNVTKAADADGYIFQIYKAAFPETGEPSQDDLVASDTLAKAALPYVPTATFTESTQYWFRVKATSSTYEDSDWAKSTFTTGSAGKWPNDPNALDYGLTGAWTATINSTKFPGYESGTEIPVGHITVDKITYGYKGKYYGDRVQLAVCYGWDEKSYAVRIPTQRFEMFKINKPGTLSFVPYASGTPTIVIALIVKKNNVETASYIYKRENVTCWNKSGEKDDYRQSFEITEAMLSGIQESATVYIFSDAGGGFNCFPITWTPVKETKATLSTNNYDFSEGWKL